MASTINSMSYTNRDVVSIRKEMINTIPRLTNKWTDFNESDMGMVLVELMAGVTDMLNFYLDSQAFETYLDTAVQDKNVRALLRSMNYRIPLARPARTRVKIVFTDNSHKDITIPKYTKFTSASTSSIVSYLAKDTVVKSGEFTEMQVPVVEGTYREITYSKDELENNVNVEGNVSRRIYLGYTNVADHMVSIEQAGEIWEECEDALLKFKGGRYFSLHADADGQVYILMSVDFMDLIGANESITIKFITTKGEDGYIDANILDTINMPLDHVVRIYNYMKSSDAKNAPTGSDLQKLKPLARENARTMDRYITVEDFKTGVLMQPMVYQAIVKDWKDLDYVQEPYTLKVWCVNNIGEPLSQDSKDEIKKHLLSKSIYDITIYMLDPLNVDFDISIKLVTDLENQSDIEALKQSIIFRLQEYYGYLALTFGEDISYSLLTSRIRAVSPHIRDLQVVTPNNDIKVGPLEFPRLKNISINVVDRLEV